MSADVSLHHKRTFDVDFTKATSTITIQLTCPATYIDNYTVNLKVNYYKYIYI